jgi:hypothetical protein
LVGLNRLPKNAFNYFLSLPAIMFTIILYNIIILNNNEESRLQDPNIAATNSHGHEKEFLQK